MRENREIPLTLGADGGPSRLEKASGRTASMNVDGKSDGPVVATKPSNKDAATAASAERVERRGSAKGKVERANASRTQGRIHDAPSGLQRLREAARRDRKLKFTALLHHLTLDSLRTAYFALKRDAAAGVDGVTWEQYQIDLEVRLTSLHERVQRGAYRAKPTRRVTIAKADGGERHLGVTTVEDKIVQRALAEVLNAIYEVDFLGFSYGFRPGRNQHQALDALSVGLTRKKVGWVLDADIRGFFDAIDHGWLMQFLEHRIGDRRVLRLIQKWLTAGVLEDGKRTAGTRGSPQGAVISPLLANVYLHYSLDLWIAQWRRRHARGDVIVVRYADDIVFGFQYHWEAEHFRSALENRLAGFGLELHPDKTRLLEFGRFAASNRQARGERKPETFVFLGFLHFCGRSRQGWFRIERRTDKARMRRRLAEIGAALRLHRCKSIPEQGSWLRRVLHGYFAYHCVPMNLKLMNAFRKQVIDIWIKWLRRRSQRHRLPWKRMAVWVQRWIPRVKLQHPWPSQRFKVTTQGRSPVR